MFLFAEGAGFLGADWLMNGKVPGMVRRVAGSPSQLLASPRAYPSAVLILVIVLSAPRLDPTLPYVALVGVLLDPSTR